MIDPDLYDVGPDRVRKFSNNNDAFVAAGVDATLLKNGPVEAIVERIKLYIDRLARDGRCMIHLNQIPVLFLRHDLQDKWDFSRLRQHTPLSWGTLRLKSIYLNNAARSVLPDISLNLL